MPACVEHVFLDNDDFGSNNWKVPAGDKGITA